MKRNISPAESSFIEGGVTANIRTDGRSRLDIRPMEIETNVIPQANGSCRVRLGANIPPLTDVLVGVKAEISEPRVETPNCGSLRFTVRIQPDLNSAHEEIEDFSMEISRTISHVIGDSSSLNLAQLCIVPGRKCWDLCVDTVIFSRAGGNLIDTVSIAIRSALQTTRIPKVEVIGEQMNDSGVGKREVIDLEVSDDPEECQFFDAKGVPVCVTLCRIGQQHHIIDANALEESCSNSKLVVGITSPNGSVCGLQKVGKGSLSPSVIPEMVKTAQKIALSYISSIENVIKKEQTVSRPPIGFF